VHLLLGAELAQCGAIDEAESAFAEAVLSAPGWSIARFQLGLLQYTSGRASTARLTWQPLLALAPDDALRSFVQGFAALAGDRFGEAMAAFEAGIAQNTANAPLNADIRMVMQRVGGAASGPPSAAVAEPVNDGGVHVLLSNYQRPR
jgi:tetratricopeptide (TPR) repeat protein